MIRILQNRSIRPIYTGLLLAILFSLRIYYGHDILLSGDEVGVGVVQAVGKWELLRDSIPINQAVPMDRLKMFVTYSPEYSGGDVLSIMWKDKLHPPLYFLLLHYIIALFGNALIVLRAFSVLISVLSVFVAYLIGKEIKDQWLGYVFALFMVLSPYCLEYSVMVRLYPLAMLLALLSTYLLFKVLNKPVISFNDRRIYGYILVSLAGMYTYYSFSVILLSHFVLCFLISEKSIRNILKMVAVYLIILIMVVPWVLPFLEGIGQINAKDLYFKGSYTIAELTDFFFRTLFFPFDTPPVLESQPFLMVLILTFSLLLSLIVLGGIWLQRKNRLLMNVIISVIFYVVVSFVNDKVFNTNTFIFDRQHYYTIPILLLILAGAATGFSGKKILFIPVLTFIVLILAVGSFYRFNNKSMFDGPYYFNALNRELESRCPKADDASCLIMVNMKEKRYIIPFVYSSERNFDILLMADGLNDSLVRQAMATGKYKNIFALNIDLNERKKKRLKLKTFGEKELVNLMEISGYILTGTPYIFKNEEIITLLQFHGER